MALYKIFIRLLEGTVHISACLLGKCHFPPQLAGCLPFPIPQEIRHTNTNALGFRQSHVQALAGLLTSVGPKWLYKCKLLCFFWKYQRLCSHTRTTQRHSEIKVEMRFSFWLLYVIFCQNRLRFYSYFMFLDLFLTSNLAEISRFLF